jgi:hypothetical protein
MSVKEEDLIKARDRYKNTFANLDHTVQLFSQTLGTSRGRLGRRARWNGNPRHSGLWTWSPYIGGTTLAGALSLPLQVYNQLQVF